MWTKEKQAECCKAYYKKHIKNNPDAVAKRAKYHAEWRKKNKDKWTAYAKEYQRKKAMTSDEVIAELMQKLEKAESDIKRYSMENKRLKRSRNVAREYLTFCLQDAPNADSIFYGLDMIFKSEDNK